MTQASGNFVVCYFLQPGVPMEMRFRSLDIALAFALTKAGDPASEVRIEEERDGERERIWPT